MIESMLVSPKSGGGDLEFTVHLFSGHGDQVQFDPSQVNSRRDLLFEYYATDGFRNRRTPRSKNKQKLMLTTTKLLKLLNDFGLNQFTDQIIDNAIKNGYDLGNPGSISHSQFVQCFEWLAKLVSPTLPPTEAVAELLSLCSQNPSGMISTQNRMSKVAEKASININRQHSDKHGVGAVRRLSMPLLSENDTSHRWKGNVIVEDDYVKSIRRASTGDLIGMSRKMKEGKEREGGIFADHRMHPNRVEVTGAKNHLTQVDQGDEQWESFHAPTQESKIISKQIDQNDVNGIVPPLETLNKPSITVMSSSLNSTDMPSVEQNSSIFQFSNGTTNNGELVPQTLDSQSLPSRDNNDSVSVDSNNTTSSAEADSLLQRSNEYSNIRKESLSFSAKPTNHQTIEMLNSHNQTSKEREEPHKTIQSPLNNHPETTSIDEVLHITKKSTQCSSNQIGTPVIEDDIVASNFISTGEVSTLPTPAMKLEPGSTNNNISWQPKNDRQVVQNYDLVEQKGICEGIAPPTTVSKQKTTGIVSTIPDEYRVLEHNSELLCLEHESVSTLHDVLDSRSLHSDHSSETSGHRTVLALSTRTHHSPAQHSNSTSPKVNRDRASSAPDRKTAAWTNQALVSRMRQQSVSMESTLSWKTTATVSTLRTEKEPTAQRNTCKRLSHNSRFKLSTKESGFKLNTKESSSKIATEKAEQQNHLPQKAMAKSNLKLTPSNISAVQQNESTIPEQGVFTSENWCTMWSKVVAHLNCVQKNLKKQESSEMDKVFNLFSYHWHVAKRNKSQYSRTIPKQQSASHIEQQLWETGSSKRDEIAVQLSIRRGSIGSCDPTAVHISRDSVRYSDQNQPKVKWCRNVCSRWLLKLLRELRIVDPTSENAASVARAADMAFQVARERFKMVRNNAKRKGCNVDSNMMTEAAAANTDSKGLGPVATWTCVALVVVELSGCVRLEGAIQVVQRSCQQLLNRNREAIAPRSHGSTPNLTEACLPNLLQSNLDVLHVVFRYYADEYCSTLSSAFVSSWMSVDKLGRCLTDFGLCPNFVSLAKLRKTIRQWNKETTKNATRNNDSVNCAGTSRGQSAIKVRFPMFLACLLRIASLASERAESSFHATVKSQLPDPLELVLKCMATSHGCGKVLLRKQGYELFSL